MFAQSRLWLAPFVIFGLSGCPEPIKPPADKSGAVCSKQFQQCQLQPGVLGVCGEAPCKSGQAPPCLRCMAQH